MFLWRNQLLSFDNSFELSRLASQMMCSVEMLMYLENKSAQQIIDELQRGARSIKNIECYFFIPPIPSKTFRTELSLGNSLLSDMACYPLSMLAIAGYDLTDIVIDVHNLGTKQNPTFYIKLYSSQINIHIRVGVNSQYQNKVIISFDNNRKLSCEPFFYGREGYRKLISETNSGILTEKIYENNAFELMFLRKRSEWIASQQSRCNALCMVSSSLERLGRQAGML